MSKVSTTKVDIAIVGAGMVGASLAASLKNTGYTVALIDAQSAEQLARELPDGKSVNEFEARVSAITFASQSLLQSCGAWSTIHERKKMPYRQMYVWDQHGTANISFDAGELYQDQLGYIIENQTIVSALHQVLSDQKGLLPFFGRELKAIKKSQSIKDGYELGLDHGDILECDLLVAADGANSRVRAALSMSTREWDYKHHAIVATVKTEKPHQHTAWQRFSESGPVALLPLSDAESLDQFCSIVWSQEASRAQSLMAKDDQSFCDALTQETEGVLGQIVEVSKRFEIPLRQRHAKNYVKDGVVLIGDAAHTIHPLAGQGVNLGFKDVDALSSLLCKASAEGLPANNALYLKRYQRQRQGDNLLMMGAMEGFKRLFAQQDPAIRWLRNAGLNFVNRQGYIKNQLAKHAMGLPVG